MGSDDPSSRALDDPVRAWMARGRELNAIYSALTAQVGLSPTGDPVTDIRALGAERDLFAEALREIRDADSVDMALDPNWAARVAGAVLGKEQS